MTSLAYSFRRFAHEHDDIPAFHAAYLVGTLLAAAILHLGFFAILIALHMCLDYIKYRDYFRYSIPLTLKAMALESVTDIALFLIALSCALVIDLTMAMTMASGLSRSGLTILRAVGTILPKMRILEDTILVALNFHMYLYTPHADIRKPLTKTHRLALASIAVSTLTLLVWAWIYLGHESDLLEAVSRELAVSL